MDINELKELKTPCFILDREELIRSIKGFQNALNSNFVRSSLGYSVKTNSTPYCMQEALRQCALAEVVSHDEYKLATLCGFAPSQIIYNGPMKSKETFIEAIENGAIVNLETKRELEWLKYLPENGHYNVGVRLNINISRISPDDADGEDDNSRFGFSDETGEFKKVVTYLQDLANVSLAGLHIHRTAHSRSVRFYEQTVSYACKIIKKYGLSIDYLDVGGGYFGIFSNKPTYKDYSEAIRRILDVQGLKDLRIIVEPGNALVASCFSFLSEVIDIKQVEKDLWFVTTDGSRNDVDPFFKKKNYLKELQYQDMNRAIVSKQVVSGCTCLEYDRLFTIEDQPLLKVGDRILYNNVGAYTMCLSPLFIRYFPSVYAKTDAGYELIRGEWTAKEYMMKSIVSSYE